MRDHPGRSARETPDAELVVRGAAVHTVDETRPRAEAVAVAAGRIVRVGSDDDVAPLIGRRTEVIDAEGRAVLPGFVDAHNHVRLGSNPGAVQLADARSLEEIHAAIAGSLAAHPDADWIEGEGWNYAAIPGGRPTATMLHGVTGGRPAFLFSYDVHTVWLNREALDRLGVTGDRADLPWGRAELDPRSGEPTGFVTDFAVLGISEEGQRVPGYASDTQYARLVESLDMAIGYGITTVVEPQNGLDDLALFARARDEGTLRSRLIAAMLCLPGTDGARLDLLEEARRTFADDRLRVGAIKLYIDDVIEPHTAAMLEPYDDRPDTRGETFWDPGEFASFLVELERRGFPAFTHATGDRGIRTVLDAVQRCRETRGPRDVRHQIVHVECVHPDDLSRFAELGVVACMQPRHCAPDIVADWRRAVGTARERYAWPFRSLRDHGATLAFSSDWNVASMDPMTWLYTATTRADLEGRDAWNVEETVDLATAVRAATFGSAYANHLEHDRGSLVAGKAADLIVLSRDPFAVEEPRELLDIRTELTVVDGVVVHRTS
jgi:predicted amidohydrolase YtcJ